MKCPVPCTSPTIQEFETRIGRRFPEDYRAFLLTCNGGWPEGGDTFVVSEEYGPGDVQHFLGLGLRGRRVPATAVPFALAKTDTIELECMDLSYTWDIVGRRLPEGMVPIADEACGDLVCLCLHEADYGAVYYWDHEREASYGGPPDYLDMPRVAGSFAEFLDMLLPEEEFLKLYPLDPREPPV